MSRQALSPPFTLTGARLVPRPVPHRRAAAALVNALLIALAVIGGLAATALIVFIGLRVRRVRHPGAARAAALPPAPARAAQPLPPQRRALPAPGDKREIHLHLYGVSAQEIAAAIRLVREEQPYLRWQADAHRQGGA
jgi:hypothetical protein